MNPSCASQPAGLGMSRDYFSKHLIPVAPSIQKQVYTSPSALFHYHGITIIYAEQGHGKIIINEQSRHCRQGSIFALSYHHIGRIVPDGKLSILHCRIPLNTFFYLLANPCCGQMHFGVEEQPVLGKLLSPEKELIEELLLESRPPA